MGGELAWPAQGGDGRLWANGRGQASHEAEQIRHAAMHAAEEVRPPARLTRPVSEHVRVLVREFGR